MTNNNDGTVKAIVTTVTTKDGEEAISYETFNGSESEVKANIEALKESDEIAGVNP